MVLTKKSTRNYKSIYQQTLKEVGVQWFIYNINENPKPLNKRRLYKNQQQEKDDIKIKLEESNYE